MFVICVFVGVFLCMFFIVSFFGRWCGDLNL